MLQKVWAASGGQCGRYLAASMALQLDVLERHGELVPDQDRYSAGVRAELLAMSSATIDRYLRGAKARDQITGKSTLQTAVNAAADRVQTAVDATADWARASVNAAADWVGTAVIATVDWVQTAVTATLDWVQSDVNSAITIGRNIVNAGTSWLFNLVGIDGMCQKLQPQRHSTMVVAAGSALPRSQRLMLGTPPQPVGDPWTRPSIQVMQLGRVSYMGWDFVEMLSG